MTRCDHVVARYGTPCPATLAQAYTPFGGWTGTASSGIFRVCLSAQEDRKTSTNWPNSSLGSRRETSRITLPLGLKIRQPWRLDDWAERRVVLRGPRNCRPGNARRSRELPRRRGGTNRHSSDNLRGERVTAEVAILNKLCVALAADSIVTVTSRLGVKTYDTGTKLFTLSKFHPVGSLTYGLTEIHTVPVEVLIKEFRAQLSNKTRPSILNYRNGFISFCRRELPQAKHEDRQNFTRILRNYFTHLRESFATECSNRGIPVGQRQLSAKPGSDVFDKILGDFATASKNARKNDSLKGVTRSLLRKRYGTELGDQFQENLARYSPNSRRRVQIEDAVLDAVLSNLSSGTECGIVIAGYGGDDLYPSLASFQTDGVICGHLKIVPNSNSTISAKQPSAVFTFAQRQGARMFIRGIDPDFQSFIEGHIRTILPGIADIVRPYMKNKSKVSILRKAFEKKADDFVKDMNTKIQRDFIDKIRDAVDLLDKPELAIFAENLVRLTALRQKMSLEIETVGGEIDVAVISRHDGFIWIKRKYYFDQTLNPFFMQRYLSQ